MKAVTFPQQNMMMAKDQPEFKALPVFRGIIPGSEVTKAYPNTEEVVTCYELTEEELLVVRATGKIWIRQLVGRGLMQPQLPQVESPFTGVPE